MVAMVMQAGDTTKVRYLGASRETPQYQRSIVIQRFECYSRLG